MASFPSGIAYHADSDADDEFERSVMTSPTHLHTDSDTESELPSNEHTPTTFGTPLDDGIRPRTVITEWTPEECAVFIASLGLRQYGEAFIEHGIVGEALIALKHDELKEMGIASAGHRLKILKEVYDIKIRQDVPVEADDYIPLSAEQNPQHEMATKDDILKLTSAIMKLRDDRIMHLENQLTRLADDSRKLRTELWPLFKMVKENQPLPYRPHDASMASPEYAENALASPLPTAEPEKKTSLSRTFSKKLGLTSGTPKSHSPTHFTSTIPEGKETPGGLQPSAAANAASNSLTAGMTGGTVAIGSLAHHSPNLNTVPSPTLPSPFHQPLAPRSYQRENPAGYARYDGTLDERDLSRNQPAQTPPLTHSHSHMVDPPKSAREPKPSLSHLSNASTLVPSRELSASVPPLSSSGSLSRHLRDATGSDGFGADDSSVPQIFKSFRVALDDPCWKVLPAALRKYNIQADWRHYALYIVYGDQERCVGLEEKPLALFKDLDREGKKPMFMLRKLANGAVGDVPTVQAIKPGGVQTSAASVRTAVPGESGRTLPGGII